MMERDLRQYALEFDNRLKSLSGDSAREYALGLLSGGVVSVPELYEAVLAPALNGIEMSRAEEAGEIWKEHVKTGIVRAVVECARPFVLKEKRTPASPKKVLVVCPEEEYHELGARMGADFFTLAGFEAVFAGCNAPIRTILAAAQELRPDVIAVSVTNKLNLMALKRIVRELRVKTGCGTSVVVAGSALAHTGKTEQDFGADRVVRSYADVLALGEGRI